MAKFSKRSHSILCSADPRLQDLFIEVVATFDCKVLEAYRTNAQQDKLFHSGKSKLKGGEGKHNKVPSEAVDIAPYPIDWNDRERMTYFAGFVMGVAAKRGLKLRWGGDWNGDWEVKDNVFDDLVHFELDE